MYKGLMVTALILVASAASAQDLTSKPAGQSFQLAQGSYRQANSCMYPNGQGGLYNGCGAKVFFTYCYMDPSPGSDAQYFNCANGQLGSQELAAGGTARMYPGRYAFVACIYPGVPRDPYYTGSGLKFEGCF